MLFAIVKTDGGALGIVILRAGEKRHPAPARRFLRLQAPRIGRSSKYFRPQTEAGSRGTIKFFSVTVIQDGQHSGHFLGVRCIDIFDLSAANGAGDGDAIGDVVDGMLQGVRRAAGDLQFAVDARDWLADR